MDDHISTSEESDEDYSQIFDADDKVGYEVPKYLIVLQSMSLPVAQRRKICLSKNGRYETAPVSRITPSTLKPNYPNQDRVPLRPLLAKGASTYRHASTSGRRKSPTFRPRRPNRSSESCGVDACFKQSKAAELKSLLRGLL